MTKVVYATDHVADEGDAGVFAFERADGSNYALVVQNTNARHKSTTADTSSMALSAGMAGKILIDVLDPTQANYQIAMDGTLRITLDPQSAKILIPSDQIH